MSEVATVVPVPVAVDMELGNAPYTATHIQAFAMVRQKTPGGSLFSGVREAGATKVAMNDLPADHVYLGQTAHEGGCRMTLVLGRRKEMMQLLKVVKKLENLKGGQMPPPNDNRFRAPLKKTNGLSMIAVSMNHVLGHFCPTYQPTAEAASTTRAAHTAAGGEPTTDSVATIAPPVMLGTIGDDGELKISLATGASGPPTVAEGPGRNAGLRKHCGWLKIADGEIVYFTQFIHQPVNGGAFSSLGEAQPIWTNLVLDAKAITALGLPAAARKDWDNHPYGKMMGLPLDHMGRITDCLTMVMTCLTNPLVEGVFGPLDYKSEASDTPESYGMASSDPAPHTCLMKLLRRIEKVLGKYHYEGTEQTGLPFRNTVEVRTLMRHVKQACDAILPNVLPGADNNIATNYGSFREEIIAANEQLLQIFVKWYEFSMSPSDSKRRLKVVIGEKGVDGQFVLKPAEALCEIRSALRCDFIVGAHDASTGTACDWYGYPASQFVRMVASKDRELRPRTAGGAGGGLSGGGGTKRGRDEHGGGQGPDERPMAFFQKQRPPFQRFDKPGSTAKVALNLRVCPEKEVWAPGKGDLVREGSGVVVHPEVWQKRMDRDQKAIVLKAWGGWKTQHKL